VESGEGIERRRLLEVQYRQWCHQVESGEGIESTSTLVRQPICRTISWNPVKELKEYDFRNESSTHSNISGIR